MSKFIKYLGSAHINTLNVALYESGAVRVENVVNSKSIGARKFENAEVAEVWFDGLTGNNMSRLAKAISILAPGKTAL